MSLVLETLRSRAAMGNDAVAVMSGESSLTSVDLFTALEQAAERLSSADVRVLAISSDNSPDWVVADLAARMAGATVVPLAPFFSQEQVAHVLQDSGADAIVADEAGSVALQSLPTTFVMQLTSRLSLLRLNGRNPNALPAGTAKISYTSGTTGAPKGVCLTQAAMEDVAQSLCSVTESLGIERHLCLLPLATLLENIGGVFAPMLAGVSIALPPLEQTGLLGASGLDVSKLLACIREFEPHSIILLPQLLAAVVAAVEQGAWLPRTLQFVAVGGGVVGEALVRRAEACSIPVFEGYGLTECCSVVSVNTPAASKPGSVGMALPHCSVRIGADSEVIVRGAAMTSYLGEPADCSGETATGDIGEIDAEGFLFIRGRKKNVIVTSFGRNLSPEWVESSLVSTTSIRQAVLFGDARPFNLAVIVPVAEATIDDIGRDIADMNARLPDYARVRRWILASSSFGVADGTATPNGRIVREAVHALYSEQIEDCFEDLLASIA